MLRVATTGIDLQPDRSRVVTRLFVPGREDVGPGDSRAAPVIERIMGLDDGQVDEAMTAVDGRFHDRHRDLDATFDAHAAKIWSYLDPAATISDARRRLLGASFTHEYAIEGAALCNPSAVVLPRRDATDDAAFVMSVRGIGEGHRSTIGFRTGTVTAGGDVRLDPAGRFPVTAAPTPGRHHRSVFHAKLAEIGDHHENAAYVLDALPARFDDDDLTRRTDALGADTATRRHTATTIAHLHDLARSSYRVEFPATSELSERVLWPHSPAERHGMEDARFVRFCDDWGDTTYYATYTAFDGTHVAQHVLETRDFLSFTASPMAGRSAAGKGLALFPRKVGGRYAALTRADRETNAVAFSDDLRCWPTATTIQVPTHSWEIIQLGNCGSPIETDAGWLVLTHGAGPMRTYSLGALLLDLDDPCRVIATATTPILSPDLARHDSYVPNVVYSCGAFAHHDTLVLPYGIADQRISIVTLSIDALLSSMRRAR